ncbi:hypothetical protein NDU88_007050 [Pleurodeles waltl]|uniref:Uncharacterized protein n=1 Tax=Pleurodeles waltl TaxID=8319 RepID=A0AAV7LUA9_PLEWA|nr:hypothetical protein NDU88_007050 [Pleurodeles waltl]
MRTLVASHINHSTQFCFSPAITCRLLYDCWAQRNTASRARAADGIEHVTQRPARLEQEGPGATFRSPTAAAGNGNSKHSAHQPHQR